MTVTKKIKNKTDSKHRLLTGVMRFDAFDYMYTEPRLALWELQQRREDAILKGLTRQNLGGVAEELLKKFRQPRAIFFRQIATPTHETLRFLRMAKQMKLKPLILEYYDDKFVSAENRSKRLLGKMPIYKYTGSDGRDMVEYETVCDFNAVIGKKFKEVICLNGEKLISFHHHLFRAISKVNPKTCTFDASAWFNSAGGNAGNYYEQILTILIRDGILFENFMPFRSEHAFTKIIVEPAFEKCRNAYGVNPLIVRLMPEHEEMRLFWDSYPSKTKNYIWT